MFAMLSLFAACSIRAVAVLETGEAVQGNTNFKTGPHEIPTPILP